MAIATAVCAIRLRSDPAMFACCYFAAVGTALSAIDIMSMRLPDVLTLPSYPLLMVALLLAATESGDFRPLGRSLEAGLLLLAAFAVLCVVSGTGLGDLKLSGLIGLILGYFGWRWVFQGLLFGFLLGACWVAACHARGKAQRQLPLGPFLVAGALAVMLA